LNAKFDLRSTILHSLFYFLLFPLWQEYQAR